jgi:hypothetical protein
MISFVPVRPLSFPGSCSPPLHRHSSIPTWVRRVWLFLHHHFVNTHGSIEICRRSHYIDTPHPVAREHVLEAESTRPDAQWADFEMSCHAWPSIFHQGPPENISETHPPCRCMVHWPLSLLSPSNRLDDQQKRLPGDCMVEFTRCECRRDRPCYI